MVQFKNRILHLCHDNPDEVQFTLEIDRNGQGNWEEYLTIPVPAYGYSYFIFPLDLEAEWIRIKCDHNVNSVSAYFHYSSPRQKLEPSIFHSLTPMEQSAGHSEGIIRPGSDADMPLQFAANILDESGNIIETGYYIMDGNMLLYPVNDPNTENWLRTNAATTKDFMVDDASIIMLNHKGKRYRLPKSEAIYDSATASGWPRGKREVVTERELMNIHGTFYELPRSSSGGLAKIRPICTHNRMIYDYCSWRGMLVLSGNLTGLESDEHYIRCEDGKVGLWLGNVDDLWKLGAPRGTGGPWKNTTAWANYPSEPYLMTGYEKKIMKLSHSLQEEVQFTVEVDFLGNDTWCKYDTFAVSAGQTLVHTFPEGYSAHWVRVKTNKNCFATALFIYNPVYDGANGLYDYAVLAEQWLSNDCGYCEGADLNNDGRVDLYDLEKLSTNWLNGF